MIREAIVKLVNKENLTYEMAEGAMDEIMEGKADPIQISAFLTAMTMKGETIEEITACANGMRKHGVHRNMTRMFWKSSEPAEINPIPSTSPQQHPL